MNKRISKSDSSNPYKSPATPKLAEALGATVDDLDRIWKSMGVMNDLPIDTMSIYGRPLTFEEYREAAVKVAKTHFSDHVASGRIKAVLVFMWLMKRHKKLMQRVIDDPYTYIDIKYAMTQETSEMLETVLRGKIFPMER